MSSKNYGFTNTDICWEYFFMEKLNNVHFSNAYGMIMQEKKGMICNGKNR